ncbi:hypothetical protein [Tissierella sp.]|uniref:hypothetical protein n=1 Tax=Tissierella sp. TaxID=41274 RepID=UPI003027E3C3
MKKRKNFIREKKIFCGDYLEVDIIPKTKIDKRTPEKRNKKKKVSAPKQRRLNDKNARRYFIQLVNTNFNEDDLHLNVTYSDDELPASIEEAEKEVKNYIRRIDYRRKKEGLPPTRYVLVTEGTVEKGGEDIIRIHHHLYINGGLDRDVVESLWRRRRRKGEKEGKRIGYVNADRLQPNNFGLEGLSRYLMKNPKGKKRWSCSQNLERPTQRNNDHRYTKREVERIVKDYSEDQTYWEKKYPGYWFTECKTEYNDLTGWSIYLKLRRSG